jgi:hypothetical protein
VDTVSRILRGQIERRLKPPLPRFMQLAANSGTTVIRNAVSCAMSSALIRRHRFNADLACSSLPPSGASPSCSEVGNEPRRRSPSSPRAARARWRWLRSPGTSGATLVRRPDRVPPIAAWGGLAFFIAAWFQQAGIETATVTNTGFLTALTSSSPRSRPGC